MVASYSDAKKVITAGTAQRAELSIVYESTFDALLNGALAMVVEATLINKEIYKSLLHADEVIHISNSRRSNLYTNSDSDILPLDPHRSLPKSLNIRNYVLDKRLTEEGTVRVLSLFA